MKTIFVILLLALVSLGQTQKDDSPHRSGFARVNGLKLHYLDWGGSGEVVLFITGMGDTAHVFDRLAPEFVDKYRVLALTRRGYGESDQPNSGYDAATLSEDVRRFLDHMKIRSVHLIGHSAAGNELTYFASKYPKRTLKVVYLDAAYDRREVPELENEDPLPEPPRQMTAHRQKIDDALMAALASYVPTYEKIQSPVLNFYAIFEKHWSVGPDTPSDKAHAADNFMATRVRPYQRRNIELFRRSLPSARVIELTGTHHYFFRDPAKRDEVVRTIREFLSSGPEVLLEDRSLKSEIRIPIIRSSGRATRGRAALAPTFGGGTTPSDYRRLGDRSPFRTCERLYPELVGLSKTQKWGRPGPVFGRGSTRMTRIRRNELVNISDRCHKRRSVANIE